MALHNGKNYYEILGVTPDSDVAEIKSAYRKLARKYHPDVNNSEEAVAKFKLITEAYETLSDNVKRSKYNTLYGFFKSYKSQTSSAYAGYKKSKEPKFEDRTVNKSSKSTSAKEEAPPPKKPEQEVKPPPKASKSEEPKQNSTKSGEFSENKKGKTKTSKNIFSDIFDEFSKSTQKPKGEKKTPVNGTDINTDISITIAESIKGSSRTINVLHSYMCPRCRGRKFINGTKCTECDGTGEISEHKKITVKIPPNIKNGAKLRVANEGNPGLHGGKNGDLYLKISVIQDSLWKYEGADILCNVPITPFEAVLGAAVEIPAFDGNLKFKVPPGTHSGQKFRLAGQGLDKNGKKGDIIVTVTIEIPDSLSNDEIKLYEKLKKACSADIREKFKHG